MVSALNPDTVAAVAVSGLTSSSIFDQRVGFSFPVAGRVNVFSSIRMSSEMWFSEVFMMR